MIRLAPIPAAGRQPLPAPLSPEARLRGPHWGGFWPAEHCPDLDDVYIELAPPEGTDGREHNAACVARKEGPFEVCADDGRTIRRYDDRWRAVGQLNRDRSAAFVLQGGIVVARRETSDVLVPDEDPAETEEQVIRRAFGKRPGRSSVRFESVANKLPRSFERDGAKVRAEKGLPV